MGVYYTWICREKREYFNPENLLLGKSRADDDELGVGYGSKYGAVPASAWAAAVLALGRWSGCAIELLDDECEDYDETVGRAEMAADEDAGELPEDLGPIDRRDLFRDVSREVLAEGLTNDLVPASPRQVRRPPRPRRAAGYRRSTWAGGTSRSRGKTTWRRDGSKN